MLDGKKYFVHDSAIVDDGAQIGNSTKIWHFTHISSGSIIGDSCNIGQNVFIADGVILGNLVKVQNNVSIYQGVICEDEVFLGPSMVFTNVINPRSGVNRKGAYTQTFVRRGATIGANATIICGIEIGKYAFIGAGSVVTKSIKNYSLVVGNPATQKGWMSEFGVQLYFDSSQTALCSESGDLYKLIDDEVVKMNE